MKFQQIRSATVKIDFAGKRFLVDPMLAPKGTYPGFEGTPNDHLRNPTVELPLPVEAIIDVDAVIVTHTHEDHWDPEAVEALPKDIMLLAQNEADAEAIRNSGFTNVHLLGVDQPFDGLRIEKTGGQHGSDEIMATPGLGERLGQVCGFVMSAEREKTFYLVGDSVWNSHVAEAIAAHKPDVIVMNSGDAQVLGELSIIMTTADVGEVYRAAPEATLISSHMEAVNHALLTRAEMRDFLAQNAMTDRVLVPEDGESYTF